MRAQSEGAGRGDIHYVFWALRHFVVTMVSVGHLRSSSLSNRVVAELECLIGQKVKMA